MRFGAGAAFGLWFGDVAGLAASPGTATPEQWLTGVGAALFVALTSGSLAGALLGPVLVPWCTQTIEALPARWAALQSLDPAVVRARIVLAGATFAALTYVAYRSVVLVELEVARPGSTAVVLVVLDWLFVAGVVLGASKIASAAQWLVGATARRPAFRWIFASSWPSCALLAAAVAGGGRRAWETWGSILQGVEWHRAGPLFGLVPGIGVVALAAPAGALRPTRASRAALAILACVAAASGAAALRLGPESVTARHIAFERALSGRFGLAAWTAVLDFDGDGQLNVLGGGDCAPFDSRRYTGAVEIPGNGIDEDCDGTDFLPVAITAPPRIPVSPAALPPRPTIVFITVDALGAPRLSPFGARTSLMPHVDALAREGAIFQRCFSEGPSTRLSFPSMFTSRWDSQLPYEPLPRLPYSFANSQRQLQDVLDDAGYETVAVLPSEYFTPARWPSLTRGFQRVDVSAIPQGLHNAPQVTDAALRILSEDHERPLYLWMHYYDAHSPYLPVPGRSDEAHFTEEQLYEAELTYIDTELGRLLYALEQRPEPTYVVLTADHSTVFHPNPATRTGHYGYDLYTATLHVPLIVRGPRVPAGATFDDLVSTMDIAPTIAQLVGADTGMSFEGRSLVPEILLARRIRGDGDRAVFHQFFLPEREFHGYEPLEMVSIHQGPYNLVLNRVRGVYELYDWTVDYYEQHDLYEERAGLPEIRRLRALLSAFVAQSSGRG